MKALVAIRSIEALPKPDSHSLPVQEELEILPVSGDGGAVR
jgi:hypothetical protein